MKDVFNIESKSPEDDLADVAWKEAKDEPIPDSDLFSEIQDKKKSGWCYIGTDRGFRSCVKVGEDDKCMSGKIFSTEAICKNPKLRK